MTIDEMMNYVGCDYIVTSKGLHIHQPKLIKRIKEKFGPEIEKFPVKTVKIKYMTCSSLYILSCSVTHGRAGARGHA